MSRSSYIVMAVLAAVVALAHAQQIEAVCDNYDCPLFEVVESYSDYEVREYPETMWVGTSAVSSSSDSAPSGMFLKLSRYISGSNNREQSIQMTVPVATKVEIRSGGHYKYTMMFYLHNMDSPPDPTDSSVKIIRMPARRVYSRSYIQRFSLASNTLASNKRYISETDALRAAINDTSKYDTSSYYRAGYNSPYAIEKYFEVWLDSA